MKFKIKYAFWWLINFYHLRTTKLNNPKCFLLGRKLTNFETRYLLHTVEMLNKALSNLNNIPTNENHIYWELRKKSYEIIKNKIKELENLYGMKLPISEIELKPSKYDHMDQFDL